MWTIIVSPVSGKRRGLEFAEKQLMPELQSRGIPHELLITKHFQHAKALAKGKDKIIVLGGDGTINEVLSTCAAKATVAVLSQGTMNFFSVCADLPSDAKVLADLISAGTVRPASLLQVETSNNSDDEDQVSFEALHIGYMAFDVCKGAGEWRSTLGPMFGIMMNLLIGCAVPTSQRGTLKIWQPNGTQITLEDQEFYWIIATYRNPYNGVVGPDLWISWMTLHQYPGFERMMKFFEPQMEHYQGTARSFPCCTKAVRFEFDCTGREYEELTLVLDGDAKPNQGRRVVGKSHTAAWNLVAPAVLPKQVDTRKIAVGGGAKLTAKPLTPQAKAWLKMHPPPRGTEFPAPLELVEEKPASKPWIPVALVAGVAAAVAGALYARNKKLW